MKKIIYTLFISLFSWSMLNAQDRLSLDFSNKTPEQRKEMIKKLSPEQRRSLYRSYRENALIEEIQVKKENQESFRRVYSEYQESQRKIKDRFDSSFDPDALNDREARIKLEESFDYGQKLIENRREYSRKMQEVIRPQQVIKMFRAEGQMRDRMLNRRMDLKENSSARTQNSRNSNPANFNSPPAGLRGQSSNSTLKPNAARSPKAGLR